MSSNTITVFPLNRSPWATIFNPLFLAKIPWQKCNKKYVLCDISAKSHFHELILAPFNSSRQTASICISNSEKKFLSKISKNLSLVPPSVFRFFDPCISVQKFFKNMGMVAFESARREEANGI